MDFSVYGVGFSTMETLQIPKTCSEASANGAEMELTIHAPSVVCGTPQCTDRTPQELASIQTDALFQMHRNTSLSRWRI